MNRIERSMLHRVSVLAMTLSVVALAPVGRAAETADMHRLAKESDLLYLVVTAREQEVPVDIAPVWVAVSTGNIHIPAGTPVGAGVVGGALGGAIASAMVNSSIEAYRRELHESRIAPLRAAVDDKTLLEVATEAVIAELTKSFGRVPTKVFPAAGAAVAEEKLKPLSSKKSIFLVRVDVKASIGVDKRDLSVSLDLRAVHFERNKSKRIRNIDISAVSSPMPERVESEVVSALAADGGAQAKKLIAEAARNAIQAGLLAEPMPLEKGQRLPRTAVLNDKVASTVVGRVLSREPHRLVYDDGRFGKIGVVTVERYLDDAIFE